jgi:tetratricopeptide (TPR) repeat protein
MGIEIGKQIKNFRIEKGVTQEELANYLGISYQAVSKWENDLTSPDIQLLPLISVYFGITIDKLFEMPDKTHMERIENMLNNERIINEEAFTYSENFLQKILKNDSENARAYFLLAQLYNHQAKNNSERASKYAKEALKYEPYVKDNHWALGVAENAYYGDLHANSHYALINYYQEFVEKHPNYWSGYLYLLDQLIADGRYDEAKTALKKVKSIKPSYVYYYYEGDMELALGNQEKAIELFNQGVKDYPEVWQVYLQRGDRFVKLGKYEEAIIDYEMALEKQEIPRYTDALISMAQVYEILGQYDKAIEAFERQIKLLNEEYDIITGEMVDEPMREIQRLKKLLK